MKRSRILGSALAAIAGLSAAGGQTTGKTEFEVASVRPANPDVNLVENHLPNLRADQGRITFRNIRLQNLIMLAYGLGKGQLSAPGSLNEALNNRYDVTAKIASGAGKDDVAPMLQNLLAERFHVAIHRENRTIPLYAMVAASGGVKLKEVADEGGESGCSRRFATSPGATHSADCRRMTSADIAQAMTALAPGYFDRPVVDASGLTGVYDFTVEWVSRAESINGKDGATIFKAVEKLGLKLEARKQAMDVVIVDRADGAPTEN